MHVYDLDIRIIIELFRSIHQKLSHHVHHAVRVGSYHDRDLSRRCFKTGALLSVETCRAHYKSLFMFQAGIEHFHAQFYSRKITDYVSLINY